MATQVASGRAVSQSLRPGDLTKTTPIPVIRASPPRLSDQLEALAVIEASGTYSNYGPLNTQFEQELASSIFHEGQCLTVCNATIGLMMAIRDVIGDDRPAERRYALMPSFTFAATAQAALWCGLTPLLCDIDAETWLPSAASEEALLREYAGQIAVVVPYATFGNNLDLARYQAVSERHSVPIVVDAAASLGSIDQNGRSFGAGFAWPVVFSMHATKLFSTGEGGVILSSDPECISRLRSMGSFGFEESRSATMLGLNSKLTEVGALTALLQLHRFSDVVHQRDALSRRYESELSSEFVMQRLAGHYQARAFESVLLPRHLASFRNDIVDQLRARGVGAATYFSPHLAEQPYFKKHAVAGKLPCTEDIASRVLTLPLFDGMTPQQVTRVVEALREVTASFNLVGPAAMLSGGVSGDRESLQPERRW